MTRKPATILFTTMLFCVFCVAAHAELDIRSSKLLEKAVRSAVMVLNTENIFLLGNEDLRLEVSGPFPELESMLLADLADSSNRYDFSANGTYTLHVKSSIHESGIFQQPHVRIKLFLKAEDQQGRIIWSDQVWSPKLRDLDPLNNWLFGVMAAAFLLVFFFIIPSAGYRMDLTKRTRISLRLSAILAFGAATGYYLW
ncbi:hypothetical protein [Maridesulfovibrio sp. FT414]|uniref:hypothetical protein n=1 Tax=Maridesulfovibrio sp. FT414 TaxID=2979469 RepID=UPI003D8069E8